ncbi:uncharacterized protein [Miscanthus floridulus]|uniref:uncharacterized protein n=1 Tax=Miscanthus floridulus TaxID=154761 RepID=UPI00345973DA
MARSRARWRNCLSSRARRQAKEALAGRHGPLVRAVAAVEAATAGREARSWSSAVRRERRGRRCFMRVSAAGRPGGRGLGGVEQRGSTQYGALAHRSGDGGREAVRGARWRRARAPWSYGVRRRCRGGAVGLRALAVCHGGAGHRRLPMAGAAVAAGTGGAPAPRLGAEHAAGTPTAASTSADGGDGGRELKRELRREGSAGHELKREGKPGVDEDTVVRPWQPELAGRSAQGQGGAGGVAADGAGRVRRRA